MEIQKIELSSTPRTASVPASNAPVEVANRRFVKRHPVLLISLLALFVLGTLGVYALNSFIVWDEEEGYEKKEADIISITSVPNNATSSAVTNTYQSDSEKQTTVNGKVTAYFTREEGKPFKKGTIRLKSGGKTVQQGNTGEGAVVVFDQVPAGSYTVEAVTEDGRTTSKSLTLGEGEITEVRLALFIDTKVTITVSVKDEADSPRANTGFTLAKEIEREIVPFHPVTTNDAGVFTQKVSPDPKWLLLYEGEQVGTIAVAPTGKDQSFNVKTHSN